MKKHDSRPRHVLRSPVLVLAVAALLAGCGENLFDTDASTPPKLNTFTASSESVVEGDTVTFTIDATGSRPITQIRLAMSGAVEGDTVIAVDSTTHVTTPVRLPIPFDTREAALTVTAWVIDVTPDTSDARTATVQVTDGTPPTVAATASPDVAGAGDEVHVTVTASDNRGLESMGTVVTGMGAPFSLDTTLASAPLTASHTFTVTVPAQDAGELTFTPHAEDLGQLPIEGEPAVVLLTDRAGPTFLRMETDPDSTIPLNDSLQVIVELADPSGIKRVTFIGLAYRGVPSQGTDEVVERFAQKTIEFPRPTLGDSLPTRFTLDPFLFSTDEDITEPVELFVVAEDSLGNVSDTTKLMYVGGPDVSISFPLDGYEVAVSDNFNVRIAIADPSGIDSASLTLSHMPGQPISLPLPAATDTPFVIVHSVTMPATEQTLQLQAIAWNTAEVSGRSQSVTVQVQSVPPTDTVSPVVSVSAERLVPSGSGNRMELLDEIRIAVSAFDGTSGLARLGLTIEVDRGGTLLRITEEATFSGSKDLEELVFQIPIDELYARLGITSAAVLDSILPEELDLRIHGFAADEAENPGCSVGSQEQRSCSPAGYSPTQFYTAADTSGLRLQVEAVRGVTVLLDNQSAVIADLTIDTVDDRLFLSNISENLVEMLQLAADSRQNQFEAPIQVGAEPRGIFLGERIVSANEPGFGIGGTPGEIARTLLVANSGGTNLSLVHMDPVAANVQEVDVIRLRTSNAVLWEIQETTGETGGVRYQVSYYDLADRPQFLAQDSLLRIIYSTVPTEAAPLTTIRLVHSDPDPTSSTDIPEVRFLLNEDAITESSSVIALANVDSIHVKAMTAGQDSVRIFAHEPGYPDRVLFNASWEDQVFDAVADVQAQIQAIMDARGNGAEAATFFPFAGAGSWDISELAWSDTTFVSASADRGKIVIGEGAKSPTGRIMMWHASEQPELSDEIQISDLVNNASEEVLGVGLNANGSLGVARGREATYFFSPDLRLQGLYRQEHSGGAGAAFHPGHDAVTDGGHTDTNGHGAAFTGTSEHSIDVVNTFHFNQVTSLGIRDNIVGPLVTGPPLAQDNGGQGAQCVALAASEEAAKDCIVVKVYGITSAGGVVVVNVRRRDLEPYATP